MRALLFGLILTTTTFGCTKTESTAGEAARTTEAASAHRAADDKATEAEQALGTAKSGAATSHEVVDADAAKARKETHDKLQQNFDASDRKFNSLTEKAADATGDKKQQADLAAADIKTREATIMAGIARLRDTTGAEWETTRAKVEADTVALNKAIDGLEATLR